MSRSLQADAPSTMAETTGVTESLSRLYYARAVFAVVWAGLLALSAATLSPLSIALLVIYPLVDIAAAGFDSRSAGARGPRGLLHLTMALSLLAAAALAVSVSSGIPSVLRVWGAWAIAAGAVQLIVALQRRQLGGQWAMILSGGLSTLAGASFLGMAAKADASLTGLAGYATLGGIFFLISAVRMHRGRTALER